MMLSLYQVSGNVVPFLDEDGECYVTMPDPDGTMQTWPPAFAGRASVPERVRGITVR